MDSKREKCSELWGCGTEGSPWLCKLDVISKGIGSYILYGKVSTAIIFVIFVFFNINDPD